jgi:uncharacterized membrane protein SirB2
MNTLRQFWQDHPNIASFLLLAVGMLIILYFSARHVGFTATQWLTLGLATVALAALSIWIISWEDDESLEEDSSR